MKRMAEQRATPNRRIDRELRERPGGEGRQECPGCGLVRWKHKDMVRCPRCGAPLVSNDTPGQCHDGQRPIMETESHE